MTPNEQIHRKLGYSVKSLRAWVEKILEESKGTEWKLFNFLTTYDVSDFQKLYNQLETYIVGLRSVDTELFENIVDKYQADKNNLSEAMKEHFLFNLLSSLALEIPFLGRSADELMEVLRQVKANLLNLENSIRVHQS